MSDRRKEPVEIRRQRILELMAQSRFVRPADVAEELRVSGETVRRDLLALESEGAIHRVHGGAIVSSEPSRVDRSVISQDKKREIARVAASLVTDDETIFMDVGTSMEAAAAALPARFSGTVVTNSLAVGAALNDRSPVELYLLGGRMRVGEMSTFGSDTLANLAQFNATTAFVGSGGVDVEAGLTDYGVEDVAIKQLMIARSARTYVLATSEKLGIRAKRFVCALQDIEGVITDSGASPTVVEELRAAGVVVITPSDIEGDA